MSARTVRRTFASSFVITLAAVPAACIVQSAPPSRGGPPPVSQPGPQPTEQAQPAQPTPAEPTVGVVSNPPRPGTEQATPEPAKFDEPC